METYYPIPGWIPRKVIIDRILKHNYKIDIEK